MNYLGTSLSHTLMYITEGYNTKSYGFVYLSGEQKECPTGLDPADTLIEDDILPFIQPGIVATFIGGRPLVCGSKNSSDEDEGKYCHAYNVQVGPMHFIFRSMNDTLGNGNKAPSHFHINLDNAEFGICRNGLFE